MTTIQHTPARKRPVNLTLSEDLVSQAKGMTSNLSAIVESLLVDYVAQQHQERQAKARQAESVAAAWNAFNESSGAFSDEYSTL